MEGNDAYDRAHSTDEVVLEGLPLESSKVGATEVAAAFLQEVEVRQTYAILPSVSSYDQN